MRGSPACRPRPGSTPCWSRSPRTRSSGRAGTSSWPGTSAAAVLVASGVADLDPCGRGGVRGAGGRPGAVLPALLLLAGPSAARLHRPVLVAPGHGGASCSGSRSSSPSASCRSCSGSRRAAATRSSSSPPARRARRHERGHAAIVGVARSCCCSALERCAAKLPGGLIALVLGIALSWALDLVRARRGGRRGGAERAAVGRGPGHRRRATRCAARRRRRDGARHLQRVARRRRRRSPRSTATRSTPTRS